MTEFLKLRKRIIDRPVSQWKPIAVELLGAQMRMVKGERWNHRVLEMGDGPPLFLNHGGGGHVETFARTLPQLAKYFHVYAADALYHGFTDKEPWDAEHEYETNADCHIDLIHALGYDKVAYEGESMGSAIGLEVMWKYPETLTALILNGVGVRGTRTDWPMHPWQGNLMELSQLAVLDPSWENIQNRLLYLVHNKETINDEMIAIRQRLYKIPEVNASLRKVFGMERAPSEGFGGQREQRSDEWVKEHWAKWNIPTLVLNGEFNPGRTGEFAQWSAGEVGALYYEVKGTGHWPQWEKPDEYSEALISFLAPILLPNETAQAK